MSRFTDDLTRELIDEINARLRDAEQLRGYAERRGRQAPFWPDRRSIERMPEDVPDRKPSDKA